MATLDCANKKNLLPVLSRGRSLSPRSLSRFRLFVLSGHHSIFGWQLSVRELVSVIPLNPVKSINCSLYYPLFIRHVCPATRVC